MKKVFLFMIGIAFLGFGAAVSVERLSIASSSGEPPPTEAPDSEPDSDDSDDMTSTPEGSEFYAEIEYQHDIDSARDYRLNVRVHPGGEWPGQVGKDISYIETQIRCQIRLRGVSVPTACDTAAQRAGRTLKEIARERRRWNGSIDYVWSLLKPQKQVRLSNPVRIAPGVVECDVEFPLGGAWHDLAAALTSDEHARIELIDGDWNWGSLHVKPY